MLDPVLDTGDGFVLFALSNTDLALLRNVVRDQYLHRIQCECPDKVGHYAAEGMASYHQQYNSAHFDHAKVWSKPNRVLGPGTYEQILRTDLFRQLNALYPGMGVSDEENFGWPNVYWRLVRPGSADIGPVHADAWFWELGHGSMPVNHYRIKIWLSLFSTRGQSGLRVVPKSQKKTDWRYHGEMRSGVNKPVLDEVEEELDLFNLPLSEGQGVIFHDRLLHGGMPNQSDASRVSLECTLLVPNKHSTS